MSPALPARSTAGPAVLAGCGALALASVPLAALLGEVPPLKLLAGLLGLALATGIVLAGWIKPVLLGLYVAAITYNRQYYSFDGLLGELGERGLYWNPADLCLAALLLLWPIERALRIAPGPGRASGRGAAAWLLPVVLAGLVSAAAGPEPLGSVFEMGRYLKLTLLLIYLHFNLDARGRAAMILALAAVVLIQAPIAVLQVAFASGQNGLSQIFQTSEPSELARRAAGTLGHPNYLAPYLLLITPPFLAIAIGRPGSGIGRAAALVGGCGCLAVLLTQSRAPILLLALSGVALVALLTVRRVLQPLRAIGLFVAGACCLVVAAVPLAPMIEKRLTGDLAASVDFRAAYNEAAVRMWESSPILGVGPNNFSLEIRRFSHDPFVILSLDALVAANARETAHLRSTAPVHNAYLFVLAELGMAGLACFLVFLCRALVVAVTASRRLDTVAGLFAAGLLCGLAAECVQQQLDYSLLWDPLLTTIVVLVGLLQSMADAPGEDT